jgi:long-chain fatty acid transport protein
MERILPRLCSVGLLVASLLTSAAHAQQGLLLSGVGPINRAIGGASTAAPIDANGALYWNPGSIAALPQSELEFGIELLYPQMDLGSSVAGGVLSGSNGSNSGLFAIPTIGLVYRPHESPWTFGLGIFGVGGFGTNYAGNPANPILSAPPPNGLGLGPLYSKLQLVQILPTAAYQITENVSFGIAPTVTLADLQLDPLFLVSPDDANGNAFFNYPSGTAGRTTWGLGVQAGLFVTTENCWNFGVTVKSPQWMQNFRWNGADENGNPRSLQKHFDLPLIVSLGTSYSGIERLLLTADVRYYAYGITQGFDSFGFNATGAVTGLGWDSIFAVAVGAQYLATDQLALRIGYVWTQNPVPDQNSIYNVISPNILTNTVSCGFTYRISAAWDASFAYLHAFENSGTGPIILPGLGALPGTSVTNQVSADAWIGGVSVRF